MPEIKEVVLNTRVTSILLIDKQFDGYLDPGYSGTVTHVSDEYIGVTLDQHISWLDPRNNVIDIHSNDIEIEDCSCLEELFWKFFKEEKK